MLKRIVDKVVGSITDDDGANEEDRDATLKLATAVLMVDVARADHVFEDEEFERVLALIQAHFDLDEDAARDLVDSAGDHAEDLVGVHDFTQALHEHLDEDEKARVVSLLWQVAYADGELDKYENSLVLKISDLLYVSRGRVMRLKHDAEQSAGATDSR
jgi:uncharacterized tellurite resistance protein B-like protein